MFDIFGEDFLRSEQGFVLGGFYVYIPLEVMRERMIARGDSPENVESRIQHAINTKELENGKYFPSNRHINNIDLQQSVESILKEIGQL